MGRIVHERPRAWGMMNTLRRRKKSMHMQDTIMDTGTSIYHEKKEEE
jgi:hypothetical protein